MIYLTDSDYEEGVKNGVKPKTLYARVYYYGYDKEKAITKPITDKEYTYWLNVAKEKGISHPTYSYRIHKKKMTYEEAATTPLDKRGRKRKV